MTVCQVAVLYGYGHTVQASLAAIPGADGGPTAPQGVAPNLIRPGKGSLNTDVDSMLRRAVRSCVSRRQEAAAAAAGLPATQDEPAGSRARKIQIAHVRYAAAPPVSGKSSRADAARSATRSGRTPVAAAARQVMSFTLSSSYADAADSAAADNSACLCHAPEQVARPAGSGAGDDGDAPWAWTLHDDINQYLATYFGRPQLRVFNVICFAHPINADVANHRSANNVTKDFFNARSDCLFRTYTYTLPTYILANPGAEADLDTVLAADAPLARTTSLRRGRSIGIYRRPTTSEATGGRQHPDDPNIAKLEQLDRTGEASLWETLRRTRERSRSRSRVRTTGTRHEGRDDVPPPPPTAPVLPPTPPPADALHVAPAVHVRPIATVADAKAKDSRPTMIASSGATAGMHERPSTLSRVRTLFRGDTTRAGAGGAPPLPPMTTMTPATPPPPPASGGLGALVAPPRTASAADAPARDASPSKKESRSLMARFANPFRRSKSRAAPTAAPTAAPAAAPVAAPLSPPETPPTRHKSLLQRPNAIRRSTLTRSLSRRELDFGGVDGFGACECSECLAEAELLDADGEAAPAPASAVESAEVWRERHAHRLSSHQFEDLQAILGLFRGTHNYSAFISRNTRHDLPRSADALEDDARYFVQITQATCSQPFLAPTAPCAADDPDAPEAPQLEWITLTFTAKAFARDQLRRMVGLAIWVLRTGAPRSTVVQAMSATHTTMPQSLGDDMLMPKGANAARRASVAAAVDPQIPAAPLSGLVLAFADYDASIPWRQCAAEVNAFAEAAIHRPRYMHEGRQWVFARWLAGSEMHYRRWLLTLGRITCPNRAVGWTGEQPAVPAIAA